MEVIKRRLGFNDEHNVNKPLYLETSSDMVVRPGGSTVEAGLADVEASVGSKASQASVNELAETMQENESSYQTKLTNAVNGVVGGAPSTGDTLNKLYTLIQGLKTTLDTLTAESGEGSINALIAAAIAAVVANAPTDFDTLKEMSDWIYSHEDDASAMNSRLQTLSNTVTAIKAQQDKYYFMNIT